MSCQASLCLFSLRSGFLNSFADKKDANKTGHYCLTFKAFHLLKIGNWHLNTEISCQASFEIDSRSLFALCVHFVHVYLFMCFFQYLCWLVEKKTSLCSMCGLARGDDSLNTHMPDVYQLSMRSVLISLTVSPVYGVSWFIDTIWNRYFNAQGLSRLRLVYKKPWVIRYVRSYKSRLINNAFESRAAHRFNISRWAWPHSWEEPTLLSLNVLYNTTSISVSIQHSPTCIEEDFQLTPSANTCNSVYLVLELSLDCIQSACEVCAASALCLFGALTN